MSRVVVTVMPPLPPGAHVSRRASRLPFPLGEPGGRVYARARHGLWHGIRALGLGEGDAALVPAYHHGSEVEAWVRAGVTCRFYRCTPGLEPDEDHLVTLLDGSVRALHLTHFLGFPRDADRWRRWCDERGLLLVEDGAMAFLAQRDGRPVGSHGDLAVYCFYKTFGTPDGAPMVASTPVPGAGRPRRSGSLLARRHTAWLAQRSAAAASAVARRRGRVRIYDPERDFELGDVDLGPTAATVRLLPRVADPAAAATRRWRYRQLLDALGDLVPPAFRGVPGGASPFGFPIEVDDPVSVLPGLAAHGVHAIDLWSVPHPTLDGGAFALEASLRRRVVLLPVHQELADDHVDLVIRAARKMTRS